MKSIALQLQSALSGCPPYKIGNARVHIRPVPLALEPILADAADTDEERNQLVSPDLEGFLEKQGWTFERAFVLDRDLEFQTEIRLLDVRSSSVYVCLKEGSSPWHVIAALKPKS